jgi:superfamily II DNA or RNA helicase
MLPRKGKPTRPMPPAPVQDAESGTAPPTCKPHHIVEGRFKDGELHSYYYQVAKETVTTFAGRQLRCALLNEHNGEAEELPAGHTAMRLNAGASARQTVLCQGVTAFLTAVSRHEAETWQLSAACGTHLPLSSCELAADLRRFAMLRHVPLQKWAGIHRYNDWYVKCSVPSVEELGPPQPPPQRSGKGRENSKGQARLFTGAKSTSSAPTPATPSVKTTTAPKALVVPEDVEAELRKYWKLHHEAAARARLEALRSHDAEAFAEHVSLLKVSALLKIMERTEAFMQRIGMRMESQAAGTADAFTSVGTEDVNYGVASSRVGAVAGCTGDTEYARFRAYVASTKNEFKLIHRIDVYVPSQPRDLQATLLPHQMDGLRFLASLHANHINGILADEMGVGKTIQTLAFLLYLRDVRQGSVPAAGVVEGKDAYTHGPQRPHLVLAPLSVIREWLEACEQLVSSNFRVCLFQELDTPFEDALAYDLVLMPVHAVRHAGAAAARVQWGYVVVDEAHKAVANLQTRTAQAILALPCNRRLVLTGTPLSGDLQELWSLLHFLNPSVFSDSDAFEEVFRRPFHVYEAKEMELTEEERGLLVLRLHQVLRPFLLRRTKADVDASLRMTFHNVRCPLSAVQQRVLGILRAQKRTPAVMQMRSADSDDSGDEEGSAGAEGGDAAVTCVEERCRGAAHEESNDAVTAHSPGVSAVDPLTRLVMCYLPGLAKPDASKMLRRNVSTDRSLGLSSANVSESAAQQVCNHAFFLPFFSQVLRRHGLDELVWENHFPYADEDSCNGAAAMTLACSGKMLLLHLLLSRLVVAGRKVVLFTHWLSCVDLIMDYLHSRGWQARAEVLTGGSSEAERKASVRRFRDDPTCLFFLLSIKAGGCGINLQSAHVVVLLDRDYTATNEDQALARVYRIGQQHTVRALFLTTDDVSEQRVTQRAEAKNRPRRAIIDDGVYRVTSPTEKATVEDAAEINDDGDDDVGVAVESGGESVIATAQVWRWAAPVQQRENTEMATSAEANGAAHHPTSPAHCTWASTQFWSSLRQLVLSFDDLVLTDDDRRNGAAFDATENSEAVENAPRLNISERAVCRLQSTLPPESFAVLQQALQDRKEALPHPASPLLLFPPHASEAAADSTCDAVAGSESQSNELENTAMRCGTAPAYATLAADNVPCDPARSPALFWLEYAYLLRLSSEGPVVLSTALDAAEENDRRKDDPAEQRRRRRQRDRRTAKRLRLATVTVPDAFREKCWGDGVEDETEVARRYLARLDERANRRKKPREAPLV